MRKLTSAILILLLAAVGVACYDDDGGSVYTPPTPDDPVEDPGPDSDEDDPFHDKLVEMFEGDEDEDTDEEATP